MKRIAIVALAFAATTAPVAAQYVSDVEPFISAVRDRDGNKATGIVDSRPFVLNSRNTKGETALIVAISRSDELWTAFLIGKGANPNFPASNGDTPLIAAARVGFTSGMEMLLGRGAKVDATNKMGETALIQAVQQRQIAAVRLLLENGADPDWRDAAAGYSAREYAKRDTRNREILAAIESSSNENRKPAKTEDLDSFKLQ
jgi:uncharacterized protein